MANTAFSIMFAAIVVYVVLGNFLYLAKILPALDKPMELMPSGQLRDIDRYIELLDEQGERPWFGPILRNVRVITVIYLLGFALTLAVIAMG